MPSICTVLAKTASVGAAKLLKSYLVKGGAKTPEDTGLPRNISDD
jgi:hypothetical protein